MTTPTPLIEIPTVVAIQLVPSSRIPLASGTLTLSIPPSTTTPDTKLLLTIDTLTIPLPSTSIAVCTKDKLSYLLATPLSRTDTGFIELTIPSIATNTTKLSDILKAHGFLKDTLVADVDDLVVALKKAIGGGGGEEVQFSETTHKIANGAVEGSAKIAELSGMVASAVSNATFEAGKWVGEKLGAGPASTDIEKGGGEKSLPREMVDQTIETTAAAASGLGKSAANVSTSIGNSASKTAEENYGQEAKGLVDSARETTGNIGKVAVDAVLGTSVVWQAGEAAVGVAKAGERKDEKVAKMEHTKTEDAETGDAEMEDIKI